MSFGDLSVQKGVRTGQSSTSAGGNYNANNKDPYSQLGESLQVFQRNCGAIKDRITEMRRRKVGPAEKADLDLQIKELRELESRIKNQIDFQFQQLETIPRTEAASKRTTLGKLQKDYERLKMNVQALSSESSFVKISRDIAVENEKFSRIGGSGGVGGSSSSASGNNNKVLTSQSDKYSGQSRIGEYGMETNTSLPTPVSSQHERAQSLTLKPLLQGREVDDAILEERNKDIIKMNQDLALVNEMFKDMAVLVEKQGEQIEDIGKATEASHERSKAGLDQINQAAAYQPTCSIC